MEESFITSGPDLSEIESLNDLKIAGTNGLTDFRTNIIYRYDFLEYETAGNKQTANRVQFSNLYTSIELFHACL